MVGETRMHATKRIVGKRKEKVNIPIPQNKKFTTRFKRRTECAQITQRLTQVVTVRTVKANKV